MRSTVDLVADVRDDGSTVLTRRRADGGLAVRGTGPGTLHLVGTAAGPLGGDVVEITVLVRSGARLRVDAVAATLALPGAAGNRALWVLNVQVDAGGRLCWTPQPLVVCEGAWLETRTAVEAHRTAEVDLGEQVVLGRHGEAGGRWRGRLSADLGGTPLLRQSQTAAALRAGPRVAGAAPVRALATRLILDGAAAARDAVAPGGTHGQAVACRLAGGGLLLTSCGPDLRSATGDLAALAALAAPTLPLPVG